MRLFVIGNNQMIFYAPVMRNGKPNLVCYDITNDKYGSYDDIRPGAENFIPFEEDDERLNRILSNSGEDGFMLRFLTTEGVRTLISMLQRIEECLVQMETPVIPVDLPNEAM